MKDFPVASARIHLLSDPDSFQSYPPIENCVPSSTAPFLKRDDKLRCGILTGFCKIDRRETGIFAQEPTHFAGAMGNAEASLLCQLMDEVSKRNCPIVGLLHSSGAKIQEGIASLAGYAEIFKRNVLLSGKVPQISLILGTCCGGAVYSPALTDFILMSENAGEMFITGPNVIRQVTGEITDRQALGGAEIHSRKSGVAHLLASDEMLVAKLLKKLLAYLPANCNEMPPKIDSEDSASRRNMDLELLAKEDKRKAYDVRKVVESIADRETFMEIQPHFAENIVIGFGRLDGISAGFVANNPGHLAGALDVNASMKAARFVRFCNAFNIPIISLVDVPGYLPGIDQEHAGIIRHGAKLLYAYAEAEVPKITVILRKAYGGAYCVMGSKQCGAFASFSWPDSEIAVMGPAGAVEILYKAEFSDAKDSAKKKQEKIEEYLRKYANPTLALKENYIDKIIQPQNTRTEIILTLKKALNSFQNQFKHKNIPL